VAIDNWGAALKGLDFNGLRVESYHGAYEFMFDNIQDPDYPLVLLTVDGGTTSLSSNELNLVIQALMEYAVYMDSIREQKANG